MLTAIKAVEGQALTLDIVGLPFGADRQEQIFTPQTNIDLDVGDGVPVYYFHGFAERATKAVSRVGRAVYQGQGTLDGVTGQIFRVTLNPALPLAHKLYADATKGMVRASSDSMAHLVRPYGIVGKAGVVTSWPISGMSLMDASTYESAINPRAIARAATIAATKAFLEEQEFEDGSGEAIKAGATFARRNRERLSRLYAALEEALPLLDEMVAEFPSDPQTPTEPEPTVPAAKSVLDLPREELIALVRTHIQENLHG